MVVERGHGVAGKKPGAASRGRRHSLVAGTDVHHPTDRSLLMDAARCMVRDVSRACGGLGLRGWRRKEYLCGKLRRLYPGVATSRLANPRPGDMEAPLQPALKLADRAEAGRAEIDGRLGIPGPSDSIRGFIGHVRPRADLIERRFLKGGTIPYRGKVHPTSGPHSPPGPAETCRDAGADAMPRRGRLSKADRVRESGEAFREARRAHAAGGSAINSLEHRGLDRVRSHGKEGFARTVALAVLAANVHR